MNLFEFSMEQFKFGKTINIVECFAGIGTQAMAWKRLAKKHDLTLNFVAISEIDKFAIQSYKAIHGEIENLGGIGSFDRFPPGIDLCSWSFPCQDISLAGKQKGLIDGSRSNYGYVFLDTIKNTPKEERPKVLLMENVPALVSAKFQKDYAEIHRQLEELGYTSWGGLLNAKDFGIPQNRERIFVVSILGEYSYTFPKAIPLELKLKDLLEESVDEKYYLSKKMIETFTAENTGKYPRKERFLENVFKENREVGNAITTRAGERPIDNFVVVPEKIKKESNGGGYRFYGTYEFFKSDNYMKGRNRFTKNKNIANTITTQQTEAVVLIPEATKQGYAIAEVGDGIYLDRPHQKRGVVQKGMTPTIKTQDKDIGVVVADNGLVRVRKLTPRETWRLMNIDDEDFDKVENIMSNAQLYKQAGNAIVVGVLEKIFEQML